VTGATAEGVRLSCDVQLDISWLKHEQSFDDFTRPVVLSPQEYLYADGTNALMGAAFRFGQVWLADLRRHPEWFPIPAVPLARVSQRL